MTDASKDLILTLYINGISDYIQGTGQTILKADYVEKIKGPGDQNLILKHKPINSVAYVKYRDMDITDFDILNGQGILYKDYGWTLEGSSSPFMHDRVNYPYKNYEVSYNAGYDKVPSDLMMLVFSLIKSKHEYDQHLGLKSYKISDVSKTWGDEIAKLSPYDKSILFKYKGFKI